LVEILKRQTAEVRPDVILAEPVGSCTDLTATLLHPLKSIYRVPLQLAPLLAVLDSRRASAHFLGGGRRGLAKEVGYIWQKQVEEAEVILINKVDLLPPENRGRLRDAIAKAFPTAKILCGSAATGEGMAECLAALVGGATSTASAVPVDYGTYARGEALLGWVNAEAGVQRPGGLCPADLLLRLAEAVQRELEGAGSEIAHFKLSFAPAKNRKALSLVNVTLNGDAPRLSRKGAARAEAGQLLVNLRAEGDPAKLLSIVQERAEAIRPACRWEWKRCAAFRPSEPKPVYRMQNPAHRL
jgi:hypothetical protein